MTLPKFNQQKAKECKSEKTFVCLAQSRQWPSGYACGQLEDFGHFIKLLVCWRGRWKASSPVFLIGLDNETDFNFKWISGENKTKLAH